MSAQKDMERLVNEAIDAMDTVREKLLDLMELSPGLSEIINANASKFVNANTALEDILSAVEDIDT